MSGKKLVLEGHTVEAIRNHINSALSILDAVLQDHGCLHTDKQELATMGRGSTHCICNDCGHSWEEKWKSI